MTSNRKMILTAGILIVLLGLAIALQDDPYEKTDDSQLPDPLTLDAESVDKIEIVNQTEAMTFEKSSDVWWMTNPKQYKADTSFTTLVLDKLKEVRFERLVSEKKDKHDQFEVGENGSRVKAFAKGKEVLRLIVGKNTPDYRGTFVRLPDSDRVYATAASLGTGFKKKVEEWRDKTIVGLKEDELNRIEFSLEDGAYALVRKEIPSVEPAAEEKDRGDVATSRWEMEGDADFRFDQTRLNQMLSSFERMKWSEIVDAPETLETYGLEKSKLFVKLTSKDGKETTVKLGKYDETIRSVWIQIEGQPAVMQLRKHVYDRFNHGKGFYAATDKK